MNRKQPSSLVTWGLAVLVPILAGAGAWLLSDVTVSRESCATGGGGVYGGAELAALALLVLAGPAAVAWRVRRATAGADMFPLLISIFLSLFLVYMGAQLWWSAHNCMT